MLDGFFLPALELIIEENFNGTLSAGLSGDAPPVGMWIWGWNVLVWSGFKECSLSNVPPCWQSLKYSALLEWIPWQKNFIPSQSMEWCCMGSWGAGNYFLTAYPCKSFQLSSTWEPALLLGGWRARGTLLQQLLFIIGGRLFAAGWPQIAATRPWSNS